MHGQVQPQAPTQSVRPASAPQTFLVSPNATDAELSVRLLAEHGIDARAFATLAQAAPQIDGELACLMLVEDALVEEELPALREALARLPAWMDLPLIVMARDVTHSSIAFAQAFPESGNVTFLGRPLNPLTLVSAVRVALRASARQRQAGQLLAEREQAVKLRDEFLAMLAHELRNPLAPMRNSVYLMRMLKLQDARAQKNIDMLERQIGHVVRMVDDLLDVARLERSKMVLRIERADLNRIVGAAVDSTLAAAQARGHRISLHYGAAELPVKADVVRIEQVVTNLINNAIKFTPPPGEIRVETSVEGNLQGNVGGHVEGHVSGNVEAAGSGGCACVCVIDHGIGFEPATAEKLFAPFLQASQTFERSTGGLGIGLTIVRRLAELHGGSARAESRGLGQGARFTVRLPLDTSPPEEAAGAPAPRASAPRRRVVVIEDNEDIRESLEALLQIWGHEVWLAGDGPAGLAQVLATRPDVALIDVGLPGMNGYEVARAIRRELQGAVRLVAVTGYGQPGDKAQALEAGFDTHLLKPIAPEVLEKLLEEE
jgi:signal transduction histidine kinase